MLSLNGGNDKMCTECWEAKNISPDALDSHDHAPFSPENFVPFHPFTKKYFLCKKTLLAVEDPDSDWLPENKGTKKGKSVAEADDAKKVRQTKDQTKKKKGTPKKRGKSSAKDPGSGSESSAPGSGSDSSAAKKGKKQIRKTKTKKRKAADANGGEAAKAKRGKTAAKQGKAVTNAKRSKRKPASSAQVNPAR